MSKSLIAAALFALASLSLSPAAAIDGEKLLTDAKALAGGITPGDTPGWPITLSQPGTYKLASNLNPSSGKDGIRVTAAGFRLIGFNVAQVGISSTRPGLTVRNGTIEFFRGAGIAVYGKLWVIENTRIAFNGGPGIRARELGTGGTVRNSQIVENGQWGIFVREGDEGTLYALIQNNVVSGNRWNGINANIAQIEGNLILNNGTAGYFYSHGIEIDNGTLLGNTIMGNAGLGFLAGPAVGFGNNTLSGNGAGTHSGGVELQANVCNGIPCGNT